MTLIAESEPYTQPNLDAQEQAASQEVIAGYEAYRLLCDSETDGFRKIGIQDTAAYQAAVADPKTVFCTIEGRYFPAIAPLGYEDRYEVDRCREMTGKQDVMLLTLPLERLYQQTLRPGNLFGGQELSQEFAVIVEEIEHGRHVNRAAEHEYVTSLIQGLGNLKAGEFVHPLLDKRPDNRTAWMGVFNFSIAPRVEVDEAIPQDDSQPEELIDAAWQQYCSEKNTSPIPGEDSEGTYLLTAQQLRERPEIIDALWSISEVGFGKILGANHPMSMEVTREFFEKELLTEGIYTSIRYHEGTPVCFGSLALNMDHNDWMDCDSTVLHEDIRAAQGRNETLVHFYEIISNGPQGMSFSPDVLDLFLDLAGRTSKSYRVFFESTNLSARYIPRIVTDRVNASETVDFTDEVKSLSRLHYWYFSTSNEQN